MTAAPRPPHCAIVVCHPRRDSFCAALAQRARATAEQAGFSIIMRDLYGMAFDPVLQARDIALSEGGKSPAADVEQEVSLLDNPLAVILVYPIWFGSPPGMLKGYVERVLGAGFAGPGTVPAAAGPRPRLLMTVATSGASAAWIEQKGIAASAGRIFGAYLGGALAIPKTIHVGIDNIFAGMPARRAADALDRVGQEVAAALGALARKAQVSEGKWQTLPQPTA
jgi:NAD(P)H dehydrogenase (quinone)